VKLTIYVHLGLGKITEKLQGRKVRYLYMNGQEEACYCCWSSFGACSCHFNIATVPSVVSAQKLYSLCEDTGMLSSIVCLLYF